MLQRSTANAEGDLKVSFGYQCNSYDDSSMCVSKIPRNRSFSCFSGAALSANATLANTNICNGVISTEILPSWDSPTSFRKIHSSPSLSRLDILSSSLQSSSLSNLSCSPSSPSPLEYDSCLFNSMNATRIDGFLNAEEVQEAGGAAGDDRVQAVCSEENGWLFCGIYDGFNGRDAADFLAGTLYETIIFHTNMSDWESQQNGSFQHCLESSCEGLNAKSLVKNNKHSQLDIPPYSFQHQVLDSLQRAMSQAENDFLRMVEQEMDDRPDLVSVGSCVLIGLLHGMDLYTLNLGDSRAVLATYKGNELIEGEQLKAIQLTECHTIDNEVEKSRLLGDHPDEPALIVGGKVKGKLKVTRAFGVGYLKKKKLNDALMGILRVRNLTSPPYVSTQPIANIHRKYS